MNYKWGELNHQSEVIKCITQYCSNIGIEPSDISFKHIKSGFTDNVFLITIDIKGQGKSQLLVVKEYLKDWHQKEIEVYQKLLQLNEFLGAPKLITQRQNFLVLEYLPPDNTKSIGSKDISILKDWLIAKHNFFKEKASIEKFLEEENIQINYLVVKPLLTIPKILEDQKAVKTIINCRDSFVANVKINRQLPQTLEHGDLELQNLFVEGIDKLRVIDWVNTRKGSGLFDINQYFETAEELGIKLNITKCINEISQKINFNDLGLYLPKVRQLMLLNKINFYGEKLLQGETESYSKSKPVKHLLDKYVAELIDNIERNN